MLLTRLGRVGLHTLTGQYHGACASQRTSCTPQAFHSIHQKRASRWNLRSRTLASQASTTPEVNSRPVGKSDVPGLEDMYCAAFKEYPAMQYLYEGVRDHAKWQSMHALFRKRCYLLLDTPGCERFYCAIDSQNAAGDIIGGAAIVPFAAKPSLWSQARHGLLWGWPNLRCLWRAKTLDDATSAAATKHPELGISAELMMVAVAPSYQGRGVGSRMLAECLQRWDDTHGGPLVLYTMREKNVAWYRSFGFSELEDRRLGEGFNMWLMHRPKAGA